MRIETHANYLESRTIDEIEVGDSVCLVRTLLRDDLRLLAIVSGEAAPGLDAHQHAPRAAFDDYAAPGLWSVSLILTLLVTQFPGPGTVIIDHALQFANPLPLRLGDTLSVTLTVREKAAHTREVAFFCAGANQDGVPVVEGYARVLAPTEKRFTPRDEPQRATLSDKFARLQTLLARARGLTPIDMAIAHPCDKESLRGALMSAQAGLIEPILIGPETKIRSIAAENDLDLAHYRIVDVRHSHDAAAMAVTLARNGDAEALMKGSLHTDELMAEVVAHATGLRTARRISHVFLMDVPTYPRPILITDAAVNIAPSLDDKAHIIQNAIDFAHIIGIDEPRVAILSAIETVNPKIRSTLDAAALCKMADRGQITGGILDGPLAFDNAVSIEAARTKGIRSAVAGRAEILVVPDLESGNMVAKQLEYLANALTAGIVLGASVPIVLTSRADTCETRIASCVIAALIAHARRNAQRQAE
jgi:phosphate acetyltransferase